MKKNPNDPKKFLSKKKANAMMLKIK